MDITQRLVNELNARLTLFAPIKIGMLGGGDSISADYLPAPAPTFFMGGGAKRNQAIIFLSKNRVQEAAVKALYDIFSYIPLIRWENVILKLSATPSFYAYEQGTKNYIYSAEIKAEIY